MFKARQLDDPVHSFPQPSLDCTPGSRRGRPAVLGPLEKVAQVRVMALGMGLRQRTNSAVVGLQHEVLGLASGELTSLSPPPAVLLGLVCPEQTLSVTRQRGTEEEEVRGEMNDIF